MGGASWWVGLAVVQRLKCIDGHRLGPRKVALYQGRIDPPKAGRGHATPVQPVQRAKCWRLLNLEPRFEWYHVRARHNAR